MMAPLNRLGTAVLGYATNLRIENGIPVCTLLTDSFQAPVVAQFANSGSIRALLQQSDIRNDTTRVVAIFPEESTRNVRSSPIIVATLEWPDALETVEDFQVPRIESPDNTSLVTVGDDTVTTRAGDAALKVSDESVRVDVGSGTLEVTDSETNITNSLTVTNVAGGRTTTPVLRGDLVRQQLDQTATMLQTLKTAIELVATGAGVPLVGALDGVTPTLTTPLFESDSLSVT